MCRRLPAAGLPPPVKSSAEKAEADTIRIECDKQATSVQSVEKQVKTVQTPHLYDLTTLQRVCNRIYGYTAQQTLDYVQSLYEKKLATYPRTDRPVSDRGYAGNRRFPGSLAAGKYAF